MAEEKIRVKWSKRANNSLQSIYNFISQDSIENADRLIDRMVDFGYSLNDFPNKYPLCRFQRFIKHNLRCVVFEHNYIFAYKIVKSELLIYTIAHTKRLK